MRMSEENVPEPVPLEEVANCHSVELLAQVAALPNLPGVYRYFDSHEQVLYVGKAISLKSGWQVISKKKNLAPVLATW